MSQLSDDDDLIPISALQHFLFCPRQCALIHLEQQWAEDAATMEGRLLHEAVDSGIGERRSGVRIARGIALRSARLGLIGKADAVEFREGGAPPLPVEYKRGKPKAHRADEVQLCAQAMCLEEMLDTSISEGALYYGEKRHRFLVTFDSSLRTLTENVANNTRVMLQSGITPPAKFTNACKRCSLESLCQPRIFERPEKMNSWFTRRLNKSLEENI